MAEEAIGLAKSLGWSVAWGVQDRLVEAKDTDLPELKLEEQKGRRLARQPGYTVDGEKLNEGDKVYVDDVEGYYTKDGFLMEVEQSESDDFELDEWTDEKLRERIALTCIQRVRHISPSHFFGKGKVQEIARCIEEEAATVVFINSTLSAVQHRNLEEAWNKKSADGPKISVIDRFGIILRIFSERAKTPQSKLQLQLAWLKYIKARLVRGSSGTMGGLSSLFKGTGQK
jgi:hypothetical protein